MRELKKSFFQTILQLTVLAYFFRQSARFSTGDDLTISLNQLYNLPAYLSVNSHRNHHHLPENQDSHLSLVYRTKEASQYLDDIRILNLINRIDQQESSTNNNNNNNSNLTIPYLIVAPATSFAFTSSKDLINLSETRLLLNSIELNWNNQFAKEDIEMDIDLQTIIQQDIDLGIEKSYGYGGYDFGNQSSKDELDIFGFKEQLQESQKNLDILSVNQLFERQQNDVPEGFKLILEEDTGEAVLMVINNNTVPQETPVQPSGYQNFISPPLFLNDSSAQQVVLEQPTYGGLNTPQIQLDPARPPPFLSQASVANILDDLSSQKMNNDQMDGLLFTNETTLIDESWFNSFPSLEENVVETVQYQPQEQIINNNQSLLNLNINRTDEFNNQTYFSKLVPYESNLSSNQDAFRLENQTLFGQSYIDQIIIQEENDEKNEASSIKLDESYMAKLSEDFEAFLNNFSSFDNQTSSRLTSSEDYEYEDDEDDEDSELTDYQQAEYMYLRNDNDAANFKQEAVDYDEYESSLSQQGSVALAGLMHNHTYLASDSSNSQDLTLHPYSYKNRQLKKKLAAESDNMSAAAAMNKQQETRDEMLLKANNIQIDLFHVINSSAEELSELINVYRLNKDQVNVIKDIRRRGKNKVAAQICRKRKLDSIDTLREDVDRLRDMKEKLQDDHRQMQNEIREMTIKFDNLYKQATGDNSLNASADDPIAAFIRNLKSQLNMRNDSQNGATSSFDLPAAKKSSSDDANRKKFRK